MAWTNRNMDLRLHQTSKFHVLGLAKERHPQNGGVVAREEKTTKTASSNITPPSSKPQLSVFLDIDEPYTRQMIQHAFDRHSQYFRLELGPGEGMEPIPLPDTCDFQWAEYERVDWTAVRSGQYGASSYCIRKGLCRKAQLAFYTHRHVCKHPESILKNTMPQTYILDTWAVFDESTGAASDGLADIVMDSATDKSTNQRLLIDQCLAEAKAAMEDAEQRYDASPDTVAEPVWILKPSTINKGAGIQIVHLYEQLVDICWSEPDIREWVLQQYIAPPLLLRKRKFHIRAYAVAVSAIEVYFNTDCLTLCSGTKYRNSDTSNLFAHITNTAYQELDPNFKEADCIYLWGEEAIAPILVRDKTCANLEQAGERVRHVIQQMEEITGELFSAYENEFGVFSPIEGCFEHYGLDFVVDHQWNVYLLEVNPGPDFKQTGGRLAKVIENLMSDTIDAALMPLLADEGAPQKSDRSSIGKLKLVYENQARGKGGRDTKTSIKVS